MNLKKIVLWGLLIILNSCSMEENIETNQEDVKLIDKNKELFIEGKISLDEYYESVNKGTNNNGTLIKQYIQETMGYSDDKIQEFKTHFIVDGDMVINKNTEVEYQTNANAKQNMAIYSPNFLINNLKRQKLIRVRIGQSMSIYTTQILNAMQYWNEVPYNTIRFVIATGSSTSDIQITAGVTKNPFAVAEASIPYGGVPGDFIVVNKVSFANLIPNKRLLFDAQAAAIAHELGHTIGFMHTDWRDENDGIKKMEFLAIKDPLSIMNSTVEKVITQENLIRSSLTAADKRGLQKLYPEQPLTPTYLAPVQSPITSVDLNWNVPLFPINNTIVTVKILNRGALLQSYNALVSGTKRSYKIKLPTGLGCYCDNLTVLSTVKWIYKDDEDSLPSKTAAFYR